MLTCLNAHWTGHSRTCTTSSSETHCLLLHTSKVQHRQHDNQKCVAFHPPSLTLKAHMHVVHRETQPRLLLAPASTQTAQAPPSAAGHVTAHSSGHVPELLSSNKPAEGRQCKLIKFPKKNSRDIRVAMCVSVNAPMNADGRHMSSNTTNQKEWARAGFTICNYKNFVT